MAQDHMAIRTENERAGTRAWLLENPLVDSATGYRCPWIEGYCSRTSVRAGETISFHVSTNPPSPFTLDVFRMGYYGGDGGRHMLTLGPFPGNVQPDPPIGSNRVRECEWQPCAELVIPDDWLSGVYIGKLTSAVNGIQSYLIFIVRDDRQADFIFQCSDNTWQAYNRWPDHFSLYDDGEKFWYWGLDVDVSFNRPYGKYCQLLDAPLSTGSGDWFLWEFPLAFWMESQGYDVTYISNVDTHADPANLRRAKGFLSVGHDEYYTLEMFNTLSHAVADGLNAAFFAGNSLYGRIEFLPGADGTPNRVFTRRDCFGPPDPPDLDEFPEKRRFPYTSPHERDLMGAHSVSPIVGGADWICSAPDHWIFENTGMQLGDGIPGLVGWESHGDPASIPGLVVVASGKTMIRNKSGTYTATVYPGRNGNVVFNAATCWWSDGLAEPPGYVRSDAYIPRKGPDRRVQQITANILDRIRGMSGCQ